jgi:hypothetical protein
MISVSPKNIAVFRLITRAVEAERARGKFSFSHRARRVRRENPD